MMLTGQTPTGLKINDIAYSVEQRNFVATMRTSDDHSWRFEYSGSRFSPVVKISSDDCDEKDLVCDIPLDVRCMMLKLDEINFGISAILSIEELTWLRMCWVLAHGRNFQLHTTSSDRQRPRTGRVPAPKTVLAKLGIVGLRLFTYFHVDSDVVLGSGIIVSSTLEFLQERDLNSKLGESYHNSSSAIQELFIRKGSLQPLL